MTAITSCGQGFCQHCYADSITRLCDGFVITRHDGKSVMAIPPLHPDMAFAVRRAAREHLAAHDRGDTARHPHHAGVR